MAKHSREESSEAWKEAGEYVRMALTLLTDATDLLVPIMSRPTSNAQSRAAGNLITATKRIELTLPDIDRLGAP